MDFNSIPSLDNIVSANYNEYLDRSKSIYLLIILIILAFSTYIFIKYYYKYTPMNEKNISNNIYQQY